MSALHDSSRLMMSFCRTIIFNSGVINERLFVIFASSVTNGDRAPPYPVSFQLAQASMNVSDEQYLTNASG
ncbi:MAG: hypothetical protein ACFB0E_12765 [Leptolyngbyaceae cyanobacterium]